MEYKQLGNTDLQISRIAFGCMSLQGGEKDDTALLHHALQNGINFFDTADLYDQGNNETLLGKAFKDKRKEVIVATKVGNQWRPDGSGWDWNPKKAYILNAVEDSLRRLKTDYIDLYQLHGGTLDDPIDEIIDAFEILKQQGKIRYYGISSIRPNVIGRWIQHSSLSSVMLQYSLLDRRPEEKALSLLQKNGLGVLVRGALAQGLLLGKPPKPYLEHTTAQVSAVASAIADSTTAGHTPESIALKWVLQHPAVTTTVVGMRNQDQLNAALNAVQSPPLKADVIEQLNKVATPILYKEHR